MYLVDTNIFSDDSKPAPDARISQWVRKNEASIYVSAVTLGEIQRGIAYLDEGAKNGNLRSGCCNFVSLSRKPSCRLMNEWPCDGGC
jgi:predicted nucleic acid-binding protein